MGALVSSTSMDKQTVLSRGERAYNMCPHGNMPKLFKELGITGALNGDDDWMISDDLRQPWNDNKMWLVRDQAKAHVAHMLSTGQVSRWDHVQSLLQKYDDHAAVPEGVEEGELTEEEVVRFQRLCKLGLDH